MASIAIFRPGLAIPSFAVDRAGGSSGKDSLYASFMAWKSAGSTRKTVVFTTDAIESLSSSRIDAIFFSDCLVWPAISGAAHSPALAPATIGAWAEMKTNPFATTQWEYGPRGFGCFGRSGTARTSFASGNVPTTKRIVSGDMSSSGFYRCKSILNSDGVDGGEPETHFGPRGGIPDGQERPCLSHWRRRWRRRLVDRGELREDQRAERDAHVDVFVVSERDPRRPCMDPDPRWPRSGPVPWRRPGRRCVSEPADDGRPPRASHRGWRDRLRHRWHEAGPDEGPRQCPPPGDSPPEEGTEPLAERVDAKHGRPRRGRPPVRPGLPPRGERLQRHLGGQEAGNRAAEHRGGEARRDSGRGDGRFPEPWTRVYE